MLIDELYVLELVMDKGLKNVFQGLAYFVDEVGSVPRRMKVTAKNFVLIVEALRLSACSWMYRRCWLQDAAAGSLKHP